MASEVPPLRIQKGSNGASPSKLPRVTNRPLSELSPMAIRRNSPSFPQVKAKVFGNENSPAGSSPFSNASPRLFWQGRDPNSPAREIRDSLEGLPTSTSPKKRSSIENLKKASRVKNSSMFAIEQSNRYDPSRPAILDGRPHSMQFSRTQSPFRGSDVIRKENVVPSDRNSSPMQAHQKPEPKEPSAMTNTVTPLSPSRFNTSPAKSSLSKKTGAAFRRSGFDPETGIWEDEDDIQNRQLPEGRGLHRHQKSVTFDQAPPQVNEYEEPTPAPSSCASGSREGSYESTEDDDEDQEAGLDRGSSIDHDDSFDASLEDATKTPVVLPEDWRFMSPDNANTDLARGEEDVFQDDCGSPAPTAMPSAGAYRPQQSSTGSVDSEGRSRPLPPLPPSGTHRHSRTESLSGAFERMSVNRRSLPAPPPMSPGTSKADILKMGASSSLSAEDRLRLMAIQEQERERRMRRMDSKETSPVRGGSAEDSSIDHGEPGPEISSDSRDSTPQLSRASILSGLRDQESRESSEEFVEGTNHSMPSSFDPDVPIPSLEDPTQPAIKQEEGLEEPDLYSIPDMYIGREGSDSETSANQDDDLTSQYSQASVAPLPPAPLHQGQETPRAQTPVQEQIFKQSAPEHRVSLPEFPDFGKESSFDMGFGPYLTKKEEKVQPVVATTHTMVTTSDLPDLAALRQSIQRSYTPDLHPKRSESPLRVEVDRATAGTPDSVVRHTSVSGFTDNVDTNNHDKEADSEIESSERSVSPSDSGSVVVNGREISPVSPISAEFNEKPEATEAGSADAAPGDESHDAQNNALQIEQKRVSSLVQLDIPHHELEDSLELGLEKEFDRVVEAQKRGYVMRQNTKIVVASERVPQDECVSPALPSTEGEGVLAAPTLEANKVQPSPRKTSQPTWSTEPWNGKVRRKSIRVGGERALSKRKPVEGPVPPLPGQASNAQESLEPVAEDELGEEEDWEDGMERGRLFVKVVGVKDLQMPFPQHERTYFALTLDNGLHCVTTAWLDLARSAPIGQEFELVVLNDLEFQLTLQMKLEPPKVERPQSPSKPPPSPKKQGAFGRLFGSPKKKKELEMRAQQEAQAAVKRPVTPPSAYELVQGLVAKDGSFARAYVALSEHEKHAYGRPYTVDITCFNEWALEEVYVGSSRSKKGVTQLRRRPPYEIGKLELQLLYVPKPKGAKDEDMPKSMNGAIRALREAEERMQQQANIKSFEGYLSQQGGDCPYWRRRFFRLVSTKLTAFHETTLQPRATINLAKASRLIDDKSSLTQKETSTKGGGRRKSGFAEEEEGYMFVEEGFRIRFANGEVIDFYADSTADKDEWMKALSQVVGNNVQGNSTAVKGWADMVLKREKKMKAEASGAPNLPRPGVGHMRTETYHAGTGSVQTSSPVKSRSVHEAYHRKTRSMHA
ncbi:Bud site selection protein BUD4 [Exophiala dermatitidis]